MVMTSLHSDTSERFSHIIRTLTGISLPASKAPMIEQRLRKRMVLWQLPDANSYLQALVNGELPEDELRQVIDLITTNTTSFFRENEHFVFLRNHIVPEVIAQAGVKKARMKVWSAASSEGAEAYTIAMVLAEACRTGPRFDWGVLGTDISRRMIKKATIGVYDNEQISTVAPDLARRYIMTAQTPRMGGKVRIVPELRQRVKFRHMNLMDASYPVDRDVSVIFLRNILIYFDAPDKAAVVQRMADHLQIGGYLIVGHAESMVVRCNGLEQVKPTIFKKIAK